MKIGDLVMPELPSNLGREVAQSISWKVNSVLISQGYAYTLAICRHWRVRTRSQRVAIFTSPRASTILIQRKAEI